MCDRIINFKSHDARGNISLIGIQKRNLKKTAGKGTDIRRSPHSHRTIMLANRLHVLLSLAFAAAVGVSAQTPNLDSCILNCLTQAVGNSTCTTLFVVLLASRPPLRP
jgi:hypothetical protein